MMTVRLLSALLLAAGVTAASACTPSSLVPGGCEIAAPRGVRVHAGVSGGDVTFAIRADTEGFVATWFVPVTQTALFPGDAVVGAGHPDASTPWTVVPVQLNGPRMVDVIESGVPLANVSCFQDAGRTTLRFTRPLGAGRFRLNPNAVKFYVATGVTDEFEGYNSSAKAVTANVFAGTPAAVLEPAGGPPPPGAPPPAAAPSAPAAPPPAEAWGQPPLRTPVNGAAATLRAGAALAALAALVTLA